MSRKTIAIALALFALPAFAADYVQAPGSTLVFAGKYQGEVFTGKFPGFATKFSFDPKQLAASKLDVTIPLATASTSNADTTATPARSLSGHSDLAMPQTACATTATATTLSP